jgi:chromosome segregation ATPase
VSSTLEDHARTGGSDASALAVAEGNGVEYRFRRLEDAVASIVRRLDTLDATGTRQVGIVAADMKHVVEQITELHDEVRELKQELRDARHRIGGAEGTLNLQARTVEANSKEVSGLRKSIIVSALGVSTAVVISTATMWLALGGPP